MHVVITCKYEKGSDKKHAKKSGNIDFLDAQGQVTLWSRVGSGQISNSSKLLCMSSLPASMKRIQSQTAGKEWQYRFSHYKSMGLFSDDKGQLNPQ